MNSSHESDVRKTAHQFIADTSMKIDTKIAYSIYMYVTINIVLSFK